MRKQKKEPRQKTLYTFFGAPAVRPRSIESGITQYNSKEHSIECSLNSSAIRKKYRYLHTQSRKGVLYVALNEFREFIVINLFDRADAASSSIILSGEKIAEASVDDDDALTFISVDPRFRRQKIGSGLIRFMKRRCEKFHVYGGQDYNSCYRLTADGMKLIQYCLRQRILAHEDFISSEVPVPSSPGRRRL